MHAEIAAAVAREHTPGLSPAAAARLEELLGRSPSVLELEVYAALLRVQGADVGTEWPLRVELGADGAVALMVASGRCAGVESVLGLAAVGAQPLAVVLGLPGAAAGQGTVARAEAERLGLPVTAVATESATEILGLAVGLLGAPTEVRRGPAAGDALVYLGPPTGREGLGGAAPGGFCPPPGEAAQTQTMALLRALQAQPGLVLRARAVGRGGLAQAAMALRVGSQLLLDAVPRHPVLLHPKELLLAETASRALIVVPAARAEEVLTAAQAQGTDAAVIGLVTPEDRLSVLLKPRGATTARLVCELPLLHDEPPPPRRPEPRGEKPVPSELPAALTLAAREQGAANPLLLHLRAHTATSSRPATLLHPGPPTLRLAVRYLAPAKSPTDTRPSAADQARLALAAAVSAVREAGATPVGAAWLLGVTGESKSSLPAAPSPDQAALHLAATQLGLTWPCRHTRPRWPDRWADRRHRQ